MENLFQTVYVIFSEVGNRTEIRLFTAHQPFYLEIDFTAFSQFPGRTDSFSVPIYTAYTFPLDQSTAGLRWPLLLLLGDQEDDEDHNVAFSFSPGIHLDDRTDHQHAGAGRPNPAGQQRAKQQPHIDPGRTRQLPFHDDVTGHTEQSEK